MATKDATTTTIKVQQFNDGRYDVFRQSAIIPSKIEDGLYFGSVLAARNKEVLKELNITHILTVGQSMSPLYPDDFTYKTVNGVDARNTNILRHLGECFIFIEEAKSTGGGVLVHCNLGIACSPAIATAYLMKKHAMSLKEALRHIKNTHSNALPNHGFILQLANLENTLRGIEATTIRVPCMNGRFVEFPASEKIPIKIQEGLYLGSLAAAVNKDGLKKLNITHILTLRMEKTPAYPDDFTYKVIQISDNENVNISVYFQECFDYIEKARSTGGGVLVHCMMGISRSASVVIAYLMKKHGTSFQLTLDFVKAKRPVVQPNVAFLYQLQQYEQFLIRRSEDGTSRCSVQ